VHQFLGMLIFVGFGVCKAQDTIQQRVLQGVTVESEAVREEMSAQKQTLWDWSYLHALQISDAVKFISGMAVKDYGGTGGIKTVSVHSLGANHTAVCYDGVPLSDCQSGQIDIGKLSFENLHSLSVEIGTGQYNDIFKPARLFASANILSVETRKPSLLQKPYRVQLLFKAGAYTLLNPSLLAEFRLSKKITLSISGEYLYDKGNFPYVQSYGGADDSVSIERRNNADVRLARGEINFFYAINAKNDWQIKGYFFHTNKGLPGATILYNPISKQRIWENNCFLQSQYQHVFSNQLKYKMLIKFNYAYLRYLDPLFLNAEHKLDNQYVQKEYYLSNMLEYKILRSLKMSIAQDFFVNSMTANVVDFAFPVRYNILTNISAVYRHKFLKISASALYTFALDTPKNEKKTQFHRLTPSVNVDFKLLKKDSLYLNLLYDNIFRLPTFNDMYYQLVGNRDLKPEIVHQIAVGLSFYKSLINSKLHIRLSANFYYNTVRDKIVAIPTKNLFVWSMFNFGKVNIWGADVSSEWGVFACKYLKIKILANYSWQVAKDFTDILSSTYGHQIPYTPQHTFVAGLGLHFKWFTVSYNLLAVGSRYKLAQNTEINRLEPYFDHSVGISKNLKFNKLEILFAMEGLNLANKNYQIVANFPVAGISWRIKTGIIF
jgi:outer membrane receptor protein involved in Fe transport